MFSLNYSDDKGENVLFSLVTQRISVLITGHIKFLRVDVTESEAGGAESQQDHRGKGFDAWS